MFEGFAGYHDCLNREAVEKLIQKCQDRIQYLEEENKRLRKRIIDLENKER